MRKYLLALTILVCAAWAANVKLFLKDGSYHVVREYEVQTDTDRVHFYSIERSQWEDIPLGSGGPEAHRIRGVGPQGKAG